MIDSEDVQKEFETESGPRLTLFIPRTPSSRLAGAVGQSAYYHRVDSEAWARAEPQKTEESGEKAEIFLRGIISGGNPPYLELCCVSLQLPYHGTGQLSAVVEC
jgi:hypothetical protein